MRRETREVMDALAALVYLESVERLVSEELQDPLVPPGKTYVYESVS